MKTFTLASLWLLLASFAPLQAETFTFSGLNQAVPDGDPNGLSNTQTVSTAITSIGSLTLGLDLSGGFNGDIYAYVTHSTGFTSLLNRVGRTAGDPFGYDDDGFQVTFSDSAANGDIHNYRSVTTPAPGFPLTGIWQPDARTADPDMVTDASARTAFLSSFNGLDPNGSWTLFLADLSSGPAGGSFTLNSWSLNIEATPIPEPTTILAGVGLLGLVAWRERRRFLPRRL